MEKTAHVTEEIRDPECDKLKKKLNMNFQKVEEGPPVIYELQSTRKVQLSKQIFRKEYGRSNYNTTLKEKVILMVGATGSGKTTLINGMINYILGVKFSDTSRIKLIIEATDNSQANSQTSSVSAYTIHHQEEMQVPYTLTIIDTPGFGDTRGIERDRVITSQIKEFFTCQNGIDHLDTVCFVAQSSLPRLTNTQKYIFDSIQSLFGKDIKDNILMMLTFADGQKPQILAGLEKAELPTDDEKCFKFNNSALYVAGSQDSDDVNFDQLFWKLGTVSFKRFFAALGTIQARSLILTKEVLNERGQLEVYIDGIQRDIKRGLSTLETLKQEVEVLRKHESDIAGNKDFTYTVVERVIITKPLPVGTYTTNCLQCQHTCHHPCFIPNDDGKRDCWAMTGENCRICPRKCIWSAHHNNPCLFEENQVTKTKTSEELKVRYMEAREKHLTAEQLVSRVLDEFDSIQAVVVYQTNETRKSLKRLREIALKPNPLSTTDYIDMLIEAENRDARPGFRDRIVQLNEIRQKAKLLQQYEDQGFDPFGEYKKKLEEERKKGSSDTSFWKKLGNFAKAWKIKTF